MKENHTGHNEAAVKLARCGNFDALEASRLLDDLRHVRNQADYRLQNTRYVEVGNARQDVEMAADFEICIRKCRAEPAYSQIKAELGAQK